MLAGFDLLRVLCDGARQEGKPAAKHGAQESGSALLL